MSDDRQSRRHGEGIESRWSVKENRRVYRFVHWWPSPATGEVQRLVETVPAGYRRRKGSRAASSKPLTGLEAARTMKADLRAARQDYERDPEGFLRDHRDWLPKRFREELEERQAVAQREQAEAREPLRFYAACEKGEQVFRGIVKDFMEASDGGRAYARPKDTGWALIRLGKFFNDRMLDEVEDSDVYQFYMLRVEARGPYRSDRPTTRRAPQHEFNFLAALYNWAIRRGYRLSKPQRPSLRSLPKGHPLARRPTRQKVIPSAVQLGAIFDARKRAPGGRNGKTWEGQHVITDQHRALWSLCYFTGARPESEPCRLTHGDVEFREDGWAEITYRDGKNEASNRTLPVPPVVADRLKGIMEDPPRMPCSLEAVERWRAKPVFRQRENGEAWTKDSYAAGWTATVSMVKGIDGMWLRDLRTTARTVLASADAIPYEVAERFIGHKLPGVVDAYIGKMDFTRSAEVLAEHVESWVLSWVSVHTVPDGFNAGSQPQKSSRQGL